ncbi:MAG: deoxyguanosinetriphosphate triphosphohydrolase, partial [Alphaproteobacteria bacterium]
ASHDLEVHTWPGAEAQVAALSDDIAYNNHDIDDGIRAGLFGFDDLATVPMVGRVLKDVESCAGEITEAVRVHEMVRRLINIMVTDVLKESTKRLEKLAPKHPDEIRGAGHAMIAFSSQMQQDLKTLKDFLLEHMYRHSKVNRMSAKGKRVVTELFNLFIEDPDLLPQEWAALTKGRGHKVTARAVADYIAGMTDRYALREHNKLFDITALEI